MSVNVDTGFVSRTHNYKDKEGKEVSFTDYSTNIPDCYKRVLFEGDIVRSVRSGNKLVVVRMPSGVWRALSDTETYVLSQEQYGLAHYGTVHDIEHRDLFHVYEHIYNLKGNYRYRQGVVFKD